MLMQVATAHMLYVYRDAYRHAVALLVVSGDQRTDPEHLATLLQCARTAWTEASSRPYALAAAGARKHPRARNCQACHYRSSLSTDNSTMRDMCWTELCLKRNGGMFCAGIWHLSEEG